MNDQNQPSNGPNYGIDAPDVVRRFLIVGMLATVLGCLFMVMGQSESLGWTRFLIPPSLTVGCVFFTQSSVMIWGSKVGKLRIRDRIIQSIPWRGDEMVLDVGCGHGLMLIGAAKQLRMGKAIGLDLWQKEDQAGNSREAAWQNVELEGVSNRVELKDGDARIIPYEDHTFDVVLSSWALHNIYNPAGREAAVKEIVRVLKPGGCLAIIDIRHTDEYEQVLQREAMEDLKRTGPTIIFVIPSYAVTATKRP